MADTRETSGANLNFIRPELARTPEFLLGSPNYGYGFVAPLTTDAHIDAAAWKEAKDRCEVTRIWGLRRASIRATWERAGASIITTRTIPDDEPFFKLDRHALTPGRLCFDHGA